MEFIKNYMTYNSRKLTLLEKFYFFLHKKVYEYRLKNQVHFEGKYIISVGNLSAGGTGKTPLTILLAQYFLEQDKSVLICLRGYKGTFKDNLVVSEQGKILTTSIVSGDEAYLIAFKLIENKYKNFKVVCGKKREVLVEKYGKDCDIVILDDAFQNPTVARDKDIVLIDVNDDPDNIRLIPLGRYREPIEALQRADAILLTRAKENPKNLEKWQSILKEFQKPYFISEHIKEEIVPPLVEKDVVLVCGIGNPKSFVHSVRSENLNIVKEYVFEDHHTFTNLELEQILKHNKPIITTDKDWVRLLYNPVFLQNRNKFHRYSVSLRINQFNQFIKLIYG